MMLHKKTIFIIVVSLLILAFLIFLISLFFSSDKIIILPLQSTTSITDLSSLFNNNLRTTITISNKNQEVDLFLLSQDFSFFITQKDIFFRNNEQSKINQFSKNFYDHEISSSLKIVSNRNQLVFTKYKFGRKAEESFSLCPKNNCNKKSVKMENFNFMLVEDPFDKVSGGIGLSPQEYFGDGAISLFNELYRKKFIKNNIWYIDYDYDKKGEQKLIIGKFPHEVNNKYKKDDFDFLEMENKGSIYQLKMTEITIGNNDKDDYENNDNIIKDRTIEFLQDFSLIYGPPDYYKKIKNMFFNKYLSNQCTESTFTYKLIDYLYISCKDDISLEDFPPLILNINKNVKFELTYGDLFLKDNGRILFLFVSNKIEKYFNEKWSFGEPFLKKYKPVYNPKEYKIGFYGLNKNDKKKYYKAAGILGFIILIIFIVIIIFLCLFIFKKIRNRKIRKAAKEMRIEEISRNLIINKSENK